MSIFDNVETLIINNKEVESITMNSNNSVLYQRADPVVSLNGVDNSSLSTCNLEATLTLRGVPLSGRTVYFLANGVSVGSAVTNSNGVASYSYDYSGVSGNVNMTASYNSFLSETYLISSTLLYENNGNTLEGIDQNYLIYETPRSGGFSIYTDGTNIHVPYGRYGSCIWPISALDGVDSFHIEFDSYRNDYDSFPSFAMIDTTTGSVVRPGYFINWYGTLRYQWIHHIVEISNSNMSHKLYNSNGDLVCDEQSSLGDFPVSSARKGLNSGYNRGLDDILYKNIVVTRL